MMKEHKVARIQLYNDEESQESDIETEYVAPTIEFDIVEVNNQNDNNDNDPSNNNKEEEVNDEFDFPLFASSAPVVQQKAEENRGRSDHIELMKVSLREPSEERVDNERPISYYFANYTTQERNQFDQCALSYDDVFKLNFTKDNQPWRVIDLKSYNLKIENENKRNKKKSRPGKKKRDNIIKCRDRKIEKLKLIKKMEQEKKKLQFKQNYQRNNKRSFVKKGKAQNKSSVSKPKYRTE